MESILVLEIKLDNHFYNKILEIYKFFNQT